MISRRREFLKTMQKKHIGRTIFLILFLLILLAAGGYYIATRYYNVEIPFMQTVEETVKGWISGVGAKEETAYVQSVAKILGVGYTGKSNRYSGVVEAKDVIEINPDSELKILERFVEAGDTVSEGTPLFAYDVESLSLSYEQLLIDIMGLENTIRSSAEEAESLEKRIARTKENKQYELKLKLSEVQLAKRKAEYELKSKQKQAEELDKAINDSVVKSPVAGRIRSVKSEDDSSNPYGSMGQETSNAYITIVAGTDYCVKGTVNEQTVRTLTEGMTVTVRPRTDENILYKGKIYRINTEEPIADTGSYYYDAGGGERSSKYAFYVSLESIDGLMMGQHVTIELGEPGEDDGKMWLPSYYLMQDGNRWSVYKASQSGKIEKQTVTVGSYSEEKDSYEIVSGLSFIDKIAFPDESVKEGMTASETLYAGEGGYPVQSGAEEDVLYNEGTDPEDPFGENMQQDYTFETNYSAEPAEAPAEEGGGL